MLITAEIICIRFPPLIRIELKDKYPSWYKRCLFKQNINEIPDSATLLILPASKLICLEQRITHMKMIAFGNSDLLESSFLLSVDDYLKDPWDCSELVIRSSKFLNEIKIIINNNEIICKDNRFYINKTLIHLTKAQTKILKVFFENLNVYFDYMDLHKILPPGLLSSEASLYVQIHRIRKILNEMLPDCYGKSIILKNSKQRGYILFIAVDKLCKTVDKL